MGVWRFCIIPRENRKSFVEVATMAPGSVQYCASKRCYSDGEILGFDGIKVETLYLVITIRHGIWNTRFISKG